MKKFISATIILLVATVSLAVISLTACDGNNNGQVKITSAMFTNCRVDLSESHGLGIAQKDETLSQDKNYMVSLNEDGTLKDVVFLSSSGKETTQEQIKGQIVKLSVTEKFTFIMFSSSKNPSSFGNDDRRFYFCRSTEQTFVIDNSTGKIYSLEQLLNDSCYLSIEEDYVRVDDYSGGSTITYYGLSIKTETLVVTNLTPSPAITYEKVILDKFGNYYVGINSVDEQIDNVFYYNYTDILFETGIHYGKASDGSVYKVNISNKFIENNSEITVKKMNADFEETDLEPSAAASISIKREFDEVKVLIKGEKMLYANDYSFIFSSYNDGKYVYDERVLFLPCKPAFLREEVFYIRDYKLYHYDWLTKTETFVLDGVKELKEEMSNLYAYVESVTGTKKYNITFESGQSKYTLVSEKTYDRTIITIQPLN